MYFACEIFYVVSYNFRRLTTQMYVILIIAHEIYHVFSFHWERSLTNILTAKVSQSMVHRSAIGLISINWCQENF